MFLFVPSVMSFKKKTDISIEGCELPLGAYVLEGGGGGGGVATAVSAERRGGGGGGGGVGVGWTLRELRSGKSVKVLVPSTLVFSNPLNQYEAPDRRWRVFTGLGSQLPVPDIHLFS